MKKQLLVTAVVVLLLSGINAQKRLVKTKLNLTETTFYIKNVASGKYLDLPGYGVNAQKHNGARVQLWDMDSGSDRKFIFKTAGGNYYYIMPQHCNSRLDVHGCYPDKWFCGTYKNKKGAPIQIWSFNTADVGKWRLEKVRSGQYMIVNKYSGKVLDADANKIRENGCRVQQWEAHKGDNQLWELICVKTGKRYE